MCGYIDNVHGELTLEKALDVYNTPKPALAGFYSFGRWVP
jgi:hypothetical protein